MILPWLVNVDKLGLKINIFDILDVMVLCFLIFFIKIKFQNIRLLLFFTVEFVFFLCYFKKYIYIYFSIYDFIFYKFWILSFWFFNFIFKIVYLVKGNLDNYTQIFFSLKDYMIFQIFVTKLILYFIKIYLNFW